MRLPRLLPLLLALFACAALAFAVPGAARAEGLAFVMNSGAASISVIDMSTHKELRRIPVLREPHHWALSPDGHSLIIGDSSGNTLFFLDPTTGAVQRRVLVADPYQLGFSPNGKYSRGERSGAQPDRRLRRRQHEAAASFSDPRDAEPPGLFAGIAPGVRDLAGARTGWWRST